ncbi:phage tail protein X [Sphingomonas sp. PP-F2F-A104-K0414]|uniref:tail protein X n=1 Tax=Sphingomonas sp. PP-F2F-A104-K0414 TaxID=2135661 RepID=UPI001042AAFA|nr:tail protein X [Sphingomonas sp. PP-F2F-A104-K0414]TCP95275.1 phage tail protein X [Sphingomonas sp. PP-F2F-A104-K0414]
MADVLTAKQGDTLDELIWRERGLGAADIGRVLALNPGVADIGAILPLGATVAMPVSMTPAPRTLPLIQLWD